MSDFSELEAFGKQLENYKQTNVPDLLEYVTKQVGARFLDRVTKLTPVEEQGSFKYKDRNGNVKIKTIKGGALRNAWVGGKDAESVDFVKYTSGLPVVRTGKNYELTLINDKEYASYVESGHMQEPGRFVPYIGKEIDGVRQGAFLKQARVKGKYMMKISSEQIKAMAPGLSEKLINEYFRKHPLT